MNANELATHFTGSWKPVTWEQGYARFGVSRAVNAPGVFNVYASVPATDPNHNGGPARYRGCSTWLPGTEDEGLELALLIAFNDALITKILSEATK